MSRTALERLIDAESALIEALDGSDPAAIEATITDFGETLDLIKATGSWHATPETIAQLTRALSLADSARARVNFLTDSNLRRMDLLAAAAGADRAPPSYGRNGRIRA